MNRKQSIVLMAAGALVVSLAACGAGEDTASDSDAGGSAAGGGDFPTGTVTFIVPGEAGGGGDILARQLAEAAGPFLDEEIVVENHTGGGGQPALTQCATREHDGHCLVHVARSTIAMNPYISEDTEYKADDFRGVIRIQVDPTYLAVQGDSEFQTIDDVVDYAKSNELQVVGGQVGSVEFVLTKLLEEAAGFQSAYVPYAGGATIGLDLAGGHADVAVINASDNLELIDSGEIRLIAVARSEPTDTYPDVPTLAESGYDIGDLDTWRGFVVPKDIDDEVVDILHEAFSQAIEDSAFQEYQSTSGLEDGYLAPADFDQLLTEQVELTQSLFDELGLQQ